MRCAKGETMNETTLHPAVSILCKLGSIAVHAEEMLSESGHDYDRIALRSLLQDEEVQTWLTEMANQAFVPRKR